MNNLINKTVETLIPKINDFKVNVELKSWPAAVSAIAVCSAGAVCFVFKHKYDCQLQVTKETQQKTVKSKEESANVDSSFFSICFLR